MKKKQLLFIAMRVACTLALLALVFLLLRPASWVLAVLAPVFYIFFDVYGKNLFKKALKLRFASQIIRNLGMENLLTKKVDDTSAVAQPTERSKGLAAMLRSAITYKYAIYFDAPAGSEHQVLMWLPYLTRLKANFVIILRSEASAKSFRSMGLPVLVITKLGDLDVVEKIGVTTVLYVNNGMRNTHMLRYNELTHVQLLHGESDKPSSYNPISTMYDFLFVSGDIAIQRYFDNGVFIPHQKFLISSRPQVENILVAGRDEPSVYWPEIDFVSAADAEKLKSDGHEPKPFEIDSETKTVFYATTWSGYQEESNFSSIETAPNLIASLIDLGYRVIFRAHPYSFKDPEQSKIIKEIAWLLVHTNRKSGVGHCFSNHPEFNHQLPEMTDCINAADVMICDISSVLADWLASNKPYMTIDTGKHEDLLESNKLSSGGHVLHHSLRNLEELMTDAVGTDSMAEKRLEVRRAALGLELNDKAEDIFAEKMNFLLEGFDKQEFLAPIIEEQRRVFKAR